MGIDVIHFSGKEYPKFQSEGFSSQYIFPLAMKVCKGDGYDIGCGRKDWSLPGSLPVDISFSERNGESNKWEAYNLPGKVDYIFSSHCLEHLYDWKFALDYWISKINKEGVLFLYLPDFSQDYWAWHNKKHFHVFTPQIIQGFLESRSNNLKKIFVSGVDLNNSFAAMAEIR